MGLVLTGVALTLFIVWVGILGESICLDLTYLIINKCLG